MQTYFNTDELRLIQDKSWFALKVKSSEKTMSILTTLQHNVIKNNVLTFIQGVKEGKITKGENLLGFPYFVLDLPQLSSEAEICSIRVIVWWGNYVSVNLLVGVNNFNRLKNKLREKMPLLQSESFFVSKIDSLWHHDLDNTNHYMRSQFLKQEYFDASRSFKVAIKFDLSVLNEIEVLESAIKTLNNMLV